MCVCHHVSSLHMCACEQQGVQPTFLCNRVPWKRARIMSRRQTVPNRLSLPSMLVATPILPSLCTLQCDETNFFLVMFGSPRYESGHENGINAGATTQGTAKSAQSKSPSKQQLHLLCVSVSTPLVHHCQSHPRCTPAYVY